MKKTYDQKYAALGNNELLQNARKVYTIKLLI